MMKRSREVLMKAVLERYGYRRTESDISWAVGQATMEYRLTTLPQGRDIVHQHTLWVERVLDLLLPPRNTIIDFVAVLGETYVRVRFLVDKEDTVLEATP